MGRHRFEAGVRFLLDQQVYIIRAALVEDRFQLENLSFGGQTIKTRAELVTAWSEQRLQFEVTGHGVKIDTNQALITSYTVTDFQSLPEAQRQEAWLRYQDVINLYHGCGEKQLIRLSRSEIKGYFAQKRTSPSVPNTEVAPLLHAKSAATLERWTKAFVESRGDIRALVSLTHLQGGRGKSRLDPDADRIVENVLKDCMRTPTHRTVDQVFTLILNRFEDENKFRHDDERLFVPALSTIYRRIDQAGMQNVLRRRLSRSEAQAQDSSDPGPKTSRILERVEIDSSILPIFVVDFEDRLPIGRAGITVAQDHDSRMPCGWHISFEPSSYLTVMSCLKESILPKPDCQALYQTTNPFPVYGLPETLVVDRGKPYVSGSLIDALYMLGIIHEWMPPRTPWFKGGIERFIRTPNQGLFEGMPGYTFSNILQKGDYDPSVDACISLSALNKILHIFMIDIYAQRWHRGIEDIPARRWERSLKDGNEPVLSQDAEELRIILCASDERIIGRRGIEFETLIYQSPDLARLRSLFQSERIRFRYDPNDISVIHVFDSKGTGNWLTIPAIDQKYTQGLSLYKHRIIRDYVLQDKGSVDIFALAHAKKHIQETVEKEFMVTRKTRGRLRTVRFLQSGNLPPTPSPKLISGGPSETPLNSGTWGGDYELPHQR